MNAAPEVLADRYLLLDTLGTGGAGAVWRAHDRLLDRPVAVKLLHADLVHDPATAARFRSEATAAARLTHPNAVVVYDIGRDGSHDYLVMELVEGSTLADLVARGPLEPGATAHLGRSVAAGLGAAHRRGMVHRDVKPANVLVTLDGVAKVADFGIARVLGEAASRLTLPGTVMGTARYLAPEQFRDDEVGPPADVYALGLLLWEAVTGTPPWGDGTQVEIAARRLERDLPSPSTRGVELPPGLDAVIARATRLDPDERHADGEVLAAALADLVPASAPARLAGLVDGARRDARAPVPAPRAATRSPLPPPPAAAGTGPSAPPGPPAAPAPPTPSSPWPDPAAGAEDGTATLDVPGPVVHGRRASRTARLALVLALLVAVGVGILGMLDTGVPGAPLLGDGTLLGEQASPAPIVAVGDHDPLGDGRERPDRLQDAVDGDPATTWPTETYDRADLIPPTKDGVGIWFDTGDERAIARVEVVFATDGADVEVFVGDAPPSDDARPADWGTRAVAADGVPRDATFDLPRGTRGRTVLLWFTRLPQVDGGRHRVEVGDVRIR